MLQVVQKLKDGRVEVIEVPRPQVSAKNVLVKNHFSLISTGTERSTIGAARKSLLGKARARPQQVNQVITSLRNNGVSSTLRSVESKLNNYSQLGYSCAGVVVEVGEQVQSLNVGDLVACSGAGYANHAEIVSVPEMMAVRLSADACMKSAAFGTLGAIAMQGIRQASVSLGETVVVIGLGLIGKITCGILKAAGVTVVGIDIESSRCKFAVDNGLCDAAVGLSDRNFGEQLRTFIPDFGADACIITAATKENDPINLAGELLRKKGVAILLGDASPDFDREPHWYQKELELRMSASYGPGRYDNDYECNSRDYPVSHVRWTMNRNMQSFQRLLEAKKLDVSLLVAEVFPVAKADLAYERIMAGVDGAVLIEYPREIDIPKKVYSEPKKDKQTRLSVSFIGAGNYAQSNLLPFLKRMSDVSLNGVVTASGSSSRSVASRFGFKFCSSDLEDVLDDTTNTVFVTTRHNTHSEYLKMAVTRGKHVFLEKPLCVSEAELPEIITAVSNYSKVFCIGYNRRYSPMLRALKRELGGQPDVINYRVSCSFLPADSWVLDPSIGGGRVVGEVCHFFDAISFLADSTISSVSCRSGPSHSVGKESLCFSIELNNGTLANLHYFANGPSKLPKESVQVYGENVMLTLDNFQHLWGIRGAKKVRQRTLSPQKGQIQMLQSFTQSIVSGEKLVPSFDHNLNVSKATFASLSSLKLGGLKVEV